MQKKALGIAKWLFIFLASIIICAYFAGKYLPAETVVTRKITISCPVAIPFAQIGIFDEWNDWSVWDLRDPQMKRSNDGNGLKVGHSRKWESKSQGGKGAQIITDIEPNKQIKMDMMMEGMGVSHEIFDFIVKDSTKTEVAWTMRVPHDDTFSRIFGYFIFEKMIAPDFEEGLKNLKAKCEKMK